MEKVVASRTEYFLATYVAPEVMTKTGKTVILFFYTLIILLCANGVTQIKTYFSMDLFVTEEFTSFDYI